MIVYVVLLRSGPDVQLAGVYATEEIAQQVSGGPGWEAEVIPCDVLDQAP